MKYQMIALYNGSRQYSWRFPTLAQARKERDERNAAEKRPGWTYITADFYGNVIA